jgi:hypothetical protein
MQSAPAFLADLTNSKALSKEPLWFTPASAIIYALFFSFYLIFLNNFIRNNIPPIKSFVLE